MRWQSGCSLGFIPTKNLLIDDKRTKITLDRWWLDNPRDDVLDRLSTLSEEWGLDILAETFFGPYKAAPEDHHFLTGGLPVQIPQCGKVTYRIFTIYQAVETLYNVSIEDNSQLTEETVQLHSVQLKRIYAHITPPFAQYKPPIPTTVVWIAQEDEICFVYSQFPELLNGQNSFLCIRNVKDVWNGEGILIKIR
jgi:hypothetical protein